ncbi:hypothetical protein BCR37DRAFT_378983 [Protomyces lactucae-debilis]|uniref:Uncharacterized protein n=1 Tax=Protomyces lactucae-debilis TaxID=2754530 RepID=A0A1Y2FGI1_PROLT|nr:uncharacterized protein BCR37DRAFT_378983 [Protomyces lactucae-debilis]ORY83041.1 hypothetical protein BCR37DRAFT_378983 [Protomyces lactucae-debilis]
MSAVATEARPVTGSRLNISRARGVWHRSTRRPVTAPAQLVGGNAWSRATTPATVRQPPPSDPVRSGPVNTISHLSYSGGYKDAEQAIKNVVVPTIRQHFPGMDFAISLVLYQDKPTVLVGVRDSESLRPYLQTQYGGLPVLLVSATTEQRTDVVDSALIDRTVDKAIGGSIASSQADFAGSFGSICARTKHEGDLCPDGLPCRPH